MNILFIVVFVASTFLLLKNNVQQFLPALLDGAENAIRLMLTLGTVYAVWMGLLQIAEDAGILQKASKGVRPLIKRIFKIDDREVTEKITVNITANFLGMGGVATPAGTMAMELLGEHKKASYAKAMLFAINCAGIQLLPTTILALKAEFGSTTPYVVLLPIYLASLVALIVGVFLTRLCYKKNGEIFFVQFKGRAKGKGRRKSRESSREKKIEKGKKAENGMGEENRTEWGQEQ